MRTLVLLPCGPGIRFDFVQDTVAGIAFYLDCSTTDLLILDDTIDGKFRDLETLGLTSIYVRSGDIYSFTDVPPSAFGPLWLKQMKALKLHLGPAHDIVFRLDTDALVTGFNPDQDARNVFNTFPEVGKLGAFEKRGDGSCKTDAMAEVGRQLVWMSSLLRSRRQILRQPKRIKLSLHLKYLIRSAREHGYTPGNTCTGAGVFMRAEMLRKMLGMNFHSFDALRFATVGDDVLFGLAAYAVGYNLKQCDDSLMSINWKGLPMSVKEAIGRGIKVIHPVKSEGDEAQERVREAFRQQRVTTTVA